MVQEGDKVVASQQEGMAAYKPHPSLPPSLPSSLPLSLLFRELVALSVSALLC